MTISLQLTDNWDIRLDGSGDLAVCEGAERVAQDVACYERTFQGEPYFAADEGVPYLNRELAELPPPELVRERANARALEVPGVTDAQTVLTQFSNRELSGVIYVTSDEGETVNVSI